MHLFEKEVRCARMLQNLYRQDYIERTIFKGKWFVEIDFAMGNPFGRKSCQIDIDADKMIGRIPSSAAILFCETRKQVALTASHIE